MIEPKITPPEPELQADTCHVCGYPIYVGSPYYDFDGDFVCEDAECLMKYCRTNFKAIMEVSHGWFD